jgi:hypothetical protein
MDTIKDGRQNLEILYESLLIDLRRQVGADLVRFLAHAKLPPPDATPTVAAAHSLLKAFRKKFREPSGEVDARALTKFLQSNTACRTWELKLANSKEEEIFGEFKRSLWNFFNPKGFPLLDNLYDALDRGNVGAGSSVGGNGTDFYTKLFSSNLTSTSSILVNLYRRYVKAFPTWSSAEEIRSRSYGQDDLVEGNRLSFAPKDREISRCICVEPNLLMFYQLGVMQILSERLRRYFGIDLSTQPDKNRELAWSGSLNDDLVTIDLASASDSMSRHMLKLVLDPHTYRYLSSLRSPVCRLPSGVVELDIFSSMGNGFTFPLQTILFSCVVEAVSYWHGRSERSCPRFGSMPSCGSHFGVFGDDIICDSDIADDVIRMLQILGFEVNLDKTFKQGPFRESCGADFYKGVDIRGVYVKKLDTQQDYIVLVNLLNQFSQRTGIRLPSTCRKAMEIGRISLKHHVVPFVENNDSGVRVPWSIAKSAVRYSRSQLPIYNLFVPRPKRMSIDWDLGVIHVPPGEKKRLYNPDGLLAAVVRGGVNSQGIPLRNEKVRYKRKRRVVPWWDYPGGVGNHDPKWQQWKTAVEANLRR